MTTDPGTWAESTTVENSIATTTLTSPSGAVSFHISKRDGVTLECLDAELSTLLGIVTRTLLRVKLVATTVPAIEAQS